MTKEVKADKPKKELTKEQKEAKELSRRKTQAKKKIKEFENDMKVYGQLSTAKFRKELKNGKEELEKNYGDILGILYLDSIINKVKENRK